MIRRKIDIFPVFLMSAFSFLQFYLFFFSDGFEWFGAFCLVYFLIASTVIAFSHHFAHCRPFNNNSAHLLMEFFIGLQTGILPNVWSLHHNVGHHGRYLDQEMDTSPWKKNGVVRNKFEYAASISVNVYRVTLGIAKERGAKIFIKTAMLFGATVITLLWLFYINPLNCILFFVLPMAISLYLAVYATHPHHSGLETDNVFESCRNNLHPFYNFITGNLGYHTAHHYKQGVHWSELPKLHKEIEHLIPEHLINRDKIFKYGRY